MKKLLDNNPNIIKLIYSKEELWLMYSGHSDLLCAKASRAIVNYTPISEYCLRFFPRKDFACFYTLYPIKTRRHILYRCKRYNNY